MCPSNEYPGLIQKELPTVNETQRYFDNFSSDEDDNGKESQKEESDEDDMEF